MACSRLILPLVLLVLSSTLGASFRLAEDTASADSADAPPDDGLLTLSAVVRMPDRSPAAGAIVVLGRGGGGDVGRQAVFRADDSGRVQFRDVFGNSVSVHASTADGAYQATMRKMAVDVRSMTKAPIELTLVPAVGHHLAVLSQGPPVEGARVRAEGFGYDIHGVTGTGKAH